MRIKEEVLTEEVIKKLSPEDIIYAEYADGGAMGDCGSTRIYALQNGKMRYYYASIYSKDDAQINGHNLGCDLLYSAAQEGLLDQCYGGFGNQAMKQPGVIFDRNDDNCSLIFTHEDKKYHLESSCLGVYKNVAREFARKRITEEAIREWQCHKNYQELADNERRILDVYADFYQKDNLDINLNDYMYAIDYIQYHNQLTTNYMDIFDLIDGATSIAKYRLRYMLEKIGPDAVEDIFFHFKISKAKKGSLFEAINTTIKTDISKKFTCYKVVQTDKSDLEDLASEMGELFKYPVVVEFSDKAHEEIQAKILALGGGGMRAMETIGYYFASCHYLLNKISLPKILPGALHVLKTMPKDDFNSTNTDITYYITAWLVDMAWSIITEGTDKYQTLFGNLVYEYCWPQIDGIWPIKHRDKFEFIESPNKEISSAGAYIFDRALSFVLGVDNLDKLNPELYDYIITEGECTNEQVYECKIRFSIDKMDEKEALEKTRLHLRYSPAQVYDMMLATYLTYFSTTPERAELLMEQFFTGGVFWEKEAAARANNWKNFLKRVKFKGVGSYVIQRVIEIFDRIKDDIGQDRMVDLYFVACAGVSEEDEITPLEQLKDKVLAIKGVDKKLISKIFSNAKKKVKEAMMQRKALREWIDNKN